MKKSSLEINVVKRLRKALRFRAYKRWTTTGIRIAFRNREPIMKPMITIFVY